MNSDVSKCDQVVFECLQKVAEVVISSRVLQQQQRLKNGRSVNSKFSLHTEELAIVRQSMEAWKGDLHMPLGIDVFWQEHERGDATPSLELLERWKITYEAKDALETKSAHLRHLYKRAIILLRTLYSFVRMVPAYQVYKRIQKAYDGRDRFHGTTRDDMGFCLYPILDDGSGGSGLDFGASGSFDIEKMHAGETERSAPTAFYSFKPLESPHGEIRVKVTYRKVAHAKAFQHQQLAETPTSSFASNMTSSIIQDYVPDELERDSARSDARELAAARARLADGDTYSEYRPRLATTPEDDATLTHTAADGENGEKGATDLERRTTISGGISTQGTGLPKNSGKEILASEKDGRSPASHLHRGGHDVDSQGDPGLGPDLLHWPSPEQGHGYTAKRVQKVVGQGPAPFLTPGPHRHKLLPGAHRRSGVDMEPLELGPTADAHLGGSRPHVASMYSGGLHVRDVRAPPCDDKQLLMNKAKRRPRTTMRSCGHGRSSIADEDNGLPSGPDASHQAQSTTIIRTPAVQEAACHEGYDGLEVHRDRRGVTLPLLKQDIRSTADTSSERTMQIVRRGRRPDEVDEAMRPMYRRNSISEAPAAYTPIARREKIASSIKRGSMTEPPQRAVESTPPFSYADEGASARPVGADVGGSPFLLGQALVTFTPPFDAGPHDGQDVDVSGIKGGSDSQSSPLHHAKIHGACEAGCASRVSSTPHSKSISPTLLETLPESPFAWRRNEQSEPTSCATGVATTLGHQSMACYPPAMTQATTQTIISRAPHHASAALPRPEYVEGLPFATDVTEDAVEDFVQNSHVFGRETGTSSRSSALTAMCIADSKSLFLTQGSESSPPRERSSLPAVQHGSCAADGLVAHIGESHARAPRPHISEASMAVRSLEDELDGFRQFHHELARQHP